MSGEAEVPSGFEMARSSVSKGICLRHGRHAANSNLSLSKANPNFQENILEVTCFYPKVK